MKSVNLKFPFNVSELLNNFELLSTEDLKNISEKITQLLSNRKNPSPEERESKLMETISKQLSPAFLKRFETLSLKMESGIISPEELLEIEAYIETKEEFDTKKIIALKEYSELKNIPIEQLMKNFNPFNRN